MIDTSLLTDKGRVRHNNEDAIGEDRSLGLLVLADGMGGYNAGEIAATMAVNHVLTNVRQRLESLRVQMGKLTALPQAEILESAITVAHKEIFRASQTHSQCAGMGTTIVASMLTGSRLCVAHVGDSRLYRFRDGLLQQITRDHSLLEELVARGHYSREEAGRLVRRNIVTRALGVEPEVHVDVTEVQLAQNDIILLCSDGLTDMLTDEQIADVLQQHPHNLTRASQALVDAANHAGGKDNISVALARLEDPLSSTLDSLRRKLSQWF